MKPSTVLVTGAAQGIGAAVAARFAGAGDRVWSVDRNGDVLETAAARAGARPLVLDLTRTDAATEAVRRIGEVDVLINCAGAVPVGTILDCSEADWDLAFAINVKAAYALSRAVLPAMLAKQGGAIVNIGSIASSVTAMPERCAYGASKAALIGLTKSIARDFAADGIRCNVICPAGVETPSMSQRFAAADDPAAMRKAFYARVPAGRFASPEEIAGLCRYLASPEAAFITGAVYTIDGGQTL